MHIQRPLGLAPASVCRLRGEVRLCGLGRPTRRVIEPTRPKSRGLSLALGDRLLQGPPSPAAFASKPWSLRICLRSIVAWNDVQCIVRTRNSGGSRQRGWVSAGKQRHLGSKLHCIGATIGEGVRLARFSSERSAGRSGPDQLEVIRVPYIGLKRRLASNRAASIVCAQ